MIHIFFLSPIFIWAAISALRSRFFIFHCVPYKKSSTQVGLQRVFKTSLVILKVLRYYSKEYHKPFLSFCIADDPKSFFPFLAQPVLLLRTQRQNIHKEFISTRNAGRQLPEKGQARVNISPFSIFPSQ